MAPVDLYDSLKRIATKLDNPLRFCLKGVDIPIVIPINLLSELEELGISVVRQGPANQRQDVLETSRDLNGSVALQDGSNKYVSIEKSYGGPTITFHEYSGRTIRYSLAGGKFDQTSRQVLEEGRA